MESKQIIGFEQSKNLVQSFFKVQFSFPDLFEKYPSKFKPEYVIDHIKGVFRKLILDIQYELMIAERIKAMQLFDNNSKELFDEFMNIKKILSPDLRSDFNIYYRNRVSRVSVYDTDLITSERRIQIYHCFLNYAIDHELFKFACVDGYAPTAKEMTLKPTNIYAMNALETIYRYFTEENGSVKSIERKLKRDGMYVAPMYQGDLLRLNLKNLYLIGLYRIYTSAMKSGMRVTLPWNIFCQRFDPVIEGFEPVWLKVLFRVAIRNNVRKEEEIQISRMIKKRYYTGDSSIRIIESSRGKKQAVFKKIKDEIKNIIQGKQRSTRSIKLNS